MRKESKTNISTNISTVNGYHARTDCHVNYAFQGWQSNKLFTSDRYIKLDDNFNRADGKPLQAYGLEIELISDSISNTTVLAEVLNKVIFTHFPADLFKLQSDCSLGGHSSAEAITQVMTRDAIRNMYPAFKAMYNNYFPAMGITAGHISCGMHVNISNGLFGKTEAAQAEAIRKLYYIVNSKFNLACDLFCRDRNATGYCNRMNAGKEYAQHMNLAYQDVSHGVCFNLGHFTEGRVELRLVAGQKDYGAFRNTMETVFHLINAVKHLSWKECDDLEAIFSGCNQYVFDRINTMCREHFTAVQLSNIRATVKREELL